MAPDRYIHGAGVFLPVEAAEWIDTCTNFNAARNATRGQLPEDVQMALAAVHVLARARRAARTAAAASAARGTNRESTSALDASSSHVDVATVAARLGMSETGVRKSLRQNRLPGIKQDGKWLIAVDDLNQYRKTA